MNSLIKKKVVVVGIGILVLLSFLVCSHSIPINHDGGQCSTSDCTYLASGLPTNSQIVLSVTGLLFLFGLAFIRNFHRQNNFSSTNQSTLSYLSPPPLTYPPGNSLFEAFRKGIIHSQIYSFVVV